MATTRTYTVALTGIEGHLVEIEADIAHGLPATIPVGLLYDRKFAEPSTGWRSGWRRPGTGPRAGWPARRGG